MTFYNIVFGIIFLAAVRELLQAAFDRRWTAFFQAATLSLVIFNDVIFTAHEIEELRLFYNIHMKIIDLLLFLLLALAVVIIEPKENVLQIRAGGRDGRKLREFNLWLVLTAYWILALGWDWVGRVYSGRPPLVWVLPLLMLIPFAALAAATFKGKETAATGILRPVMPLLMLGYIGIFKYFLYY